MYYLNLMNLKSYNSKSQDKLWYQHSQSLDKILFLFIPCNQNSVFSTRYGDRAPRSFIARIFAFIWVLIGLVIISIFTATVTTSLTALSLSNDVTIYGKTVS